MCGIAGVFSTEPVPEQVVETMLAAIGYRGPDHREVRRYRSAAGPCLTVGQNRLAIVDLSPEANQPFESTGGRSVITFNGEFYNFRRLRRELEQEGAAFRTQSDTEVALACLDRGGVDALNRIWGMFAGAYFQVDRGTFFLFRDRPGKKPLYYLKQGNRLYFASEAKAITAVLPRRPAINHRALAHYFYLGYLPNDQCVFEGMHKLAAGAALHCDLDLQPRIQSWYRPYEEPIPTEDDLETTFMDAVAIRMIADVPLAAFLSGGLDSSLVVAAMSRIADRPVNTFSVRFDGPQVLDETRFARIVAEHCRTDHHEVVLNQVVLRDALQGVLDHFDEPFGDSSALPMFVVSRAAKQQFTVALSGDGADEIFAGYRKYLGEHYLGKLGPYSLRHWLWRPLSHLLPMGRSSRILETNRRVRRLLRGDARDAARRHVRWLCMSPISPASLLHPDWLEDGLEDVEDSLVARMEAPADLNARLRFDQALVMQDDMCVKVDRMSMRASLEVRSPFIDHRLIALANGLPADRKLHGTRRKHVLIERLGHLLPGAILNRPKTGFEMPIGAWFRSELRTWVEDHLFQDGPARRWVDQTALRRVWQQHLEGELDCTETLWHHLVFANWARNYAS